MGKAPVVAVGVNEVKELKKQIRKLTEKLVRTKQPARCEELRGERRDRYKGQNRRIAFTFQC